MASGIHNTYSLKLGIALLILMLSACGVVVERDGPGRPTAVREVEDAVPKHEPKSKYGNPDSYVVNGKRYYTLKSGTGFRESGVASWYGKKFHGRRTSSGETYDMYRMTAAHKQLPLPTYVEVRNIENGRRAVVKVNDRGPFHDNRVIDLSYAAAMKLGVVDNGTAFVEIAAIAPGGTITKTRPVAQAPRSATKALPRSTTQAPSPDRSDSLGIYLQIGAFHERENAERLSNKVGPYLDNRTRIEQAITGGAPVYRVQVGPIISVHTADRFVDQLFALGIAEHRFILQ